MSKDKTCIPRDTPMFTISHNDDMSREIDQQKKMIDETLDSDIKKTPKKVVRFEVEYDDGSINYLEGEDAHDHMKQINSMVVEAHFRGQRLCDRNWKTKSTKSQGI